MVTISYGFVNQVGQGSSLESNSQSGTPEPLEDGASHGRRAVLLASHAAPFATRSARQRLPLFVHVEEPGQCGVEGHSRS
jgi:hypothetical protein